MILSRRSLFATVAIAPLVGCSLFGGTAPAVTPTQLQTDVATLAAGLNGIVQGLTGIAPADVLANIQKEIDAINADAAAIGSTATPNQTTIQQISNAVGIIATLATPFFPVAGTVAMVIQAALSFLPTILSVVGVTLAAAPRKYTVAQARMILIGAAKTVPQP